MTIVLVGQEQINFEQIFNKLWAEIFKFESKFSRFLPNSELTKFNSKAGLSVAVSDEFEKILHESMKMSKQTDGLYNPFILPAVQRSGYGPSAVTGYAEDNWPDYRERATVSADKLKINHGHATIPYNTAVDIGGLGKGYLADALANMLDEEKLSGYWVSLSGDMLVSGVDGQNKPWKIRVQSASKLSEICDVSVKTRGGQLGVATSGTFHRQGQTGGNWHHIIDPRRGGPAISDIKLCTVVAKTATLADVLASCAVILGSHKAPDFLKNKGALAYVIQTGEQVLSSGDMLSYIDEKEVVHV